MDTTLPEEKVNYDGVNNGKWICQTFGMLMIKTSNTFSHQE